MTTVLLVGMIVWIVGLECRLGINIRWLNELLEELPQEMNSLRASATATLPSLPRTSRIWHGNGRWETTADRSRIPL